MKNLRIKVFYNWDRRWWSVLAYTLFWRLGFWMLFPVAGLALCIRRSGRAVLFLFLPLFCYNIGTMLLLSGPDVRLFYFNVLILLPLAAVMLLRPGGQKEGTEDAPA